MTQKNVLEICRKVLCFWICTPLQKEFLTKPRNAFSLIAVFTFYDQFTDKTHFKIQSPSALPCCRDQSTQIAPQLTALLLLSLRTYSTKSAYKSLILEIVLLETPPFLGLVEIFCEIAPILQIFALFQNKNWCKISWQALPF